MTNHHRSTPGEHETEMPAICGLTDSEYEDLARSYAAEPPRADEVLTIEIAPSMDAANIDVRQDK